MENDDLILKLIEINDNKNLEKIEDKIDMFGKILEENNVKILNLNTEVIDIIFGKSNLNFTSKTLSRRLKSKYRFDVKSNSTKRGRIIKIKKLQEIPNQIPNI